MSHRLEVKSSWATLRDTYPHLPAELRDPQIDTLYCIHISSLSAPQTRGHESPLQRVVKAKHLSPGPETYLLLVRISFESTLGATPRHPAG